MTERIKIVGASGHVGFGIRRDRLLAAVESAAYVGADMGTVDFGPASLGSGLTGKSVEALKADLAILLEVALSQGAPLILGSAGTAGARPHVDEVQRIIEAIAEEGGLRFRLATIYSDIPSAEVLSAQDQGRLHAIGNAPAVSREVMDEVTGLVAQMGVAPIIAALERGADVVLAGRACDTSIFAAPAIREGFPWGLAMHMAKIVECASLCADPGSRDPIVAHLSHTDFELESTDPESRCTPRSVAAHSLYEQADPNTVGAPEGTLHVDKCTYIPVTNRVTRVSGSRWEDAPRPSLKVEGARPVGYRSISLGAIRDPWMIRALDEVEHGTRERIRQVTGLSELEDYTIDFIRYGQNGLFGELEPIRQSSHELLHVIDVRGESQERANRICGIARQHVLHCGYSGIRATGGNVAYQFDPVIDMGRTYEFAAYHLMEVASPADFFPMSLVDVGSGVGRRAYAAHESTGRGHPTDGVTQVGVAL